MVIITRKEATALVPNKSVMASFKVSFPEPESPAIPITNGLRLNLKNKFLLTASLQNLIAKTAPTETTPV